MMWKIPVNGIFPKWWEAGWSTWRESLKAMLKIDTSVTDGGESLAPPDEKQNLTSSISYKFTWSGGVLPHLAIDADDIHLAGHISVCSKMRPWSWCGMPSPPGSSMTWAQAATWTCVSSQRTRWTTSVPTRRPTRREWGQFRAWGLWRGGGG